MNTTVNTVTLNKITIGEILFNPKTGFPMAVLVDENGTELTTLKIYRTGEPEPFKGDERPVPGSILADRKTLRVATADGWLEVLSLQQSGKKRMDTDAFLRGYILPGGCRCQ